MKIVFNSFLRLFSILPKLYLSFYFLKVWDLTEIGKFNILSSSIAILVLIVGLDFYNYSNRELVNAQSLFTKSDILIKQFMLYICVYLIIIPVIYFLSLKYFPLGKIEICFFVILICEHLSQEIFRILNIIDCQITASVLLALRNGFWIFLLFFFNIYIKKSNVDINNMFMTWSLGSIFCTILSFLVIFRKIDIKLSNLNLNNLRLFYLKSIKVVGIYFLITILYKFLEYSGRYIIAIYFEPKILGVYGVFYQISSLLNLFFDSIFISFLYPKLIKYFNENNLSSYNNLILVTFRQMLLFGFFYIFIFYFFSKYFYAFINKPELENYDLLLIIILIGNLLYSLSFIYHYALYAIRDDRGIIYSVIFSSILNGSIFVFMHFFNIYGVALGGTLSYIGLLSFKYFIYKSNYKKLKQV